MNFCAVDFEERNLRVFNIGYRSCIRNENQRKFRHIRILNPN